MEGTRKIDRKPLPSEEAKSKKIVVTGKTVVTNCHFYGIKPDGIRPRPRNE